MIGKLTGKVEIISDDAVIIDVGGVGYLIYTTTSNISKIENGSTQAFLIETYVREDAITLFGFLNASEKVAFNKLNLVNGVGTRVALSILSSMSSHELIEAIACGNKEAFKRISGIGPKLADRIILELKDKFTAFTTISNQSQENERNLLSDAVSALCNLGISRNDSHAIVSKIMKENPEYKLDDIIRSALKLRS